MEYDEVGNAVWGLPAFFARRVSKTRLTQRGINAIMVPRKIMTQKQIADKKE